MKTPTPAEQATACGIGSALLASLGLFAQGCALLVVAHEKTWYSGVLPVVCGNIMLWCSYLLYVKGKSL